MSIAIDCTGQDSREYCYKGELGTCRRCGRPRVPVLDGLCAACRQAGDAHRALASGPAAPPPGEPRACIVCGQPLPRQRTRFCSRSCMGRYGAAKRKEQAHDRA